MKRKELSEAQGLYMSLELRRQDHCGRCKMEQGWNTRGTGPMSVLALMATHSDLLKPLLEMAPQKKTCAKQDERASKDYARKDPPLTGRGTSDQGASDDARQASRHGGDDEEPEPQRRQARYVAQCIFGDPGYQKQEEDDGLGAGGSQRRSQLLHLLCGEKRAHKRKTEIPGKQEVHSGADGQADSGVERAQPCPEQVPSHDLGNLAGEHEEDHLENLDKNEDQWRYRAAGLDPILQLPDGGKEYPDLVPKDDDRNDNNGKENRKPDQRKDSPRPRAVSFQNTLPCPRYLEAFAALHGDPNMITAFAPLLHGQADDTIKAHAIKARAFRR